MQVYWSALNVLNSENVLQVINLYSLPFFCVEYQELSILSWIKQAAQTDHIQEKVEVEKVVF